jgi:hypothetical protein
MHLVCSPPYFDAVRYVDDNGRLSHLVLVLVQMVANILPVLGFWGLFHIYLEYHNNYRYGTTTTGLKSQQLQVKQQ